LLRTKATTLRNHLRWWTTAAAGSRDAAAVDDQVRLGGFGATSCAFTTVLSERPFTSASRRKMQSFIGMELG
jgi:hypothetical protein